jgi:hypothetical protein
MTLVGLQKTPPVDGATELSCPADAEQQTKEETGGFQNGH